MTSTSTTVASTSVATTQPSSPSAEPTLRVGTVVPVTSLDPADAFTLADWELLHAINDGLLEREPGNGQIVAGIAEDLPEVSDDGRTYTFRIRSGVEFADGLELTAPLYADGIRRVMTLGGEGSDLISLFVEKVEAVDEMTVMFQLSDAYAFFPTLLTGAPYLPVHPDAYPADTIVPMPPAPVYGVGPWYIERYSESEIVLLPNPRYQGESVGLGGISIEVFATAAEMASALSRGDVDLIWRGVDAATAETLAESEGLNSLPVPGGTLHMLVVNHRREPTNDPLVRQALAEVIDREEVDAAVFAGAMDPTHSMVPEEFFGSTDAFLESYGQPDVAQAIELLTEAGFTTEAPAQLELAYPPERFGVEMASALEVLEQQIEATGLIEVTLTAQPWSSYVGDVVAGVYHVAFLGWVYDFPDPHNYLAPFVLQGGLGGSGENLAFPEMVAMIEEAAVERDEERRLTLYQEIQRLYAEDVVTIPLWMDREYVVYRDGISADQARAHPETLNIGATLQLDYRTLAVETGR